MLDHLQSEHEQSCYSDSSEVKLCPSPVSSGGVVPDLVVGAVSDPVWKRTVRYDLLGVAYLLTE